LSYLDRLELIRRLKESYLPLREIREIMNSLTDRQVSQRLKELPPSSPKFTVVPESAQPTPKPGAKALEYINRLMEDQTKYKSKEFNSLPQPIPGMESEDFLHLQRELHSQLAVTGEETWLHILLAPGVELHLRRPLDPGIEYRVQRLFSYAKRLFQLEP
jgi:DNA-binding transcriptional MerR regulator